MRKLTLRDLGRRALIALLLVSALLLLRSTGFYAGFREKLRADRIESGQSADAGTSAATHTAVSVQPIAVMICASDGGARYGTAYDGETTAAAFRRFSVDLGEALGSADAPAAISEETFRETLSACGVCVRFADPVPLRLLSGWLGTEMIGAAAGDSAATVCLSASEEQTVLSYRTPEGGAYRCATAVRPEGLRSHTEEYSPNGAIYAWESERLADGGDAVILPGAPQPAAVKSAVVLPFGEETDALLRTMGMNSFMASSYTEADGTVVYVYEENSLRISASGAVFFRRAALPETRSAGSPADAVDRAWQVAQQSIGQFAGDGSLFFAGVSYNESQETYTVLLDYMVDGIPVRLAPGHAAEFVMRGDTVIQARMQFRRFSRAEEQQPVLPYLQAAAVAAAQHSEPALIYADAGEATECMWVIADG